MSLSRFFGNPFGRIFLVLAREVAKNLKSGEIREMKPMKKVHKKFFNNLLRVHTIQKPHRAKSIERRAIFLTLCAMPRALCSLNGLPG
jgi:hypothetical protein